MAMRAEAIECRKNTVPAIRPQISSTASDESTCFSAPESQTEAVVQSDDRTDRQLELRYECQKLKAFEKCGGG